jgi:hypothetical protein
MKLEPEWPSLESDPTPLTDGERQVIVTLGSLLDDDWECYVRPALNGLAPDVVLLHPAIGVVVLEIKDWSEATLRTKVQMARAKKPRGHPLVQLELYRDELEQRLLDATSRDGRQVVGAALIVPTLPSATVEAILSKERQRFGLYPTSWYPFLGADDVNVEGLTRLEFFSPQDDATGMSPALAERLRPFLVEPDVLAMRRQPLPLNADQQRLARTRTRSGYRRIKGPVGAGKSLVLAARAAELAATGQRVLVVSFNITLWHYLRDLAVRHARSLDIGSSRHLLRGVTFLHFHDVCKRICFQAGLDLEFRQLFANRDDNDYPSEEISALAMRAAQNLRGSYDAVLVDEGQDFQPDWWAVLRQLIKPGGEAILVADRSQDLYRHARPWTEAAMLGAGFTGDWAHLAGSYRLPPNVAEMLATFGQRSLPVDFDPPVSPQLPLTPARMRWVITTKPLATAIAQEVDEAYTTLDGEDVLAMADVFYICPTNSLGRDVATQLWRNHGLRTRHTFQDNGSKSAKKAFWTGDLRVKGSTPHSIKGWEARAVVVGFNRARSTRDLTSLYVAMSRVKNHETGSLLTVVTDSRDLADFARRHFEVVEEAALGTSSASSRG